MSGEVIAITSMIDRRWSEYIEARDRANASGAITDGRAAGRAWRRWLDLFMTDSQRAALGGSVERIGS
jgi:hypothetical protein